MCIATTCEVQAPESYSIPNYDARNAFERWLDGTGPEPGTDGPDPDPGIGALPQDHVYPSNSHAGWAITALIAGSAGDTVDDALYYAGYVGAVGEFIGSAVIEPYDWFLTAKEIVNDPTSPYSYAGFIPFIPAGAGRDMSNYD